MYAIPMPNFSHFVTECGGTSSAVDRHFIENYNAVPIKGTWDQWQYMILDKEKYMEFCLRWL